MVNDTICAISTPKGVGGIAVVRVSGPDAIAVVNSRWKGADLGDVESHTAHLGTIRDTDGGVLDQCVATVFRGPGSFTGEDVVEISVHGSRWVQRRLIDLLTVDGRCRLAEPGEFTRRAFIAGKMDLAEAEAVADVIASNSRAAHRIAVSQMRGGFSRRLRQLRERLVELASLLELELDFSEEEVEFASRERLLEIAREIHSEVTRLGNSFAAGAAIKDGVPVAIAGATNAGKSSLLNALLDDDRAIVSDIHGTTRDTVEETLEIGDYLFRFIDTAGLRATQDTIERIGIERSRRAIGKARIVILTVDSTSPVDPDIVVAAADVDPARVIVAVNKTDIAAPGAVEAVSGIFSSIPADNIIPISALTRDGIDTLRDRLSAIAQADENDAHEGILVTNRRHATALRNAAASTARTIDGLTAALPGDLIAQDLRETIHHLSTITGDITTTDLLTTIFTRFCIGK